MTLCWQTLNLLEQAYGESFYLLDIERFFANYHEFLSGFQQFYPKTNLGYSYKTNYIPQLGRAVSQMGGYAEVVSQMEYDLALRIGVLPSKIIFNGPLKRSQDLESAILNGSLVNLDSFQEVSFVQSIAEKYPNHSIAIGLRCNFDIGEDRISRFGFDVNSGQLTDVFAKLKPFKNISIDGLHCHFSSALRSVESYRLRSQRMIELSQFYFRDRQPKYIDLGGGFFGKMPESLQRQFPSPIPTAQDYAQAIAPEFAKAYDPNTGPELILEPGVAIVSDVLQFVAKVVSLKTVRGRRIALTTGSIHNIKPTLNTKVLSMHLYRNEAQPPKMSLPGDVDLVGYTCMEHDCLYQAYPNPVAIEDYVVFENLGAYTIVFKPPFIQGSPPIILYNAQNRQHTLCKRRETVDDIFHSYVF
jgi:diaminopimelate decarboxylase